MAVQVVLIRGINVGGANRLPMADLRAILQAQGAEAVRTYIQSGSAVVRGTPLKAEAIADDIAAAKGFRPSVLVLDGADFETMAAGNPFPEAETRGKTLHVWFRDGAGDFDAVAAEALRTPNERVQVAGASVYLHAPDGIGRSKLAQRIERLCGVPATARNWNTVAALRQMVAEMGG